MGFTNMTFFTTVKNFLNDTLTHPNWRMVGKSVRGASHIRAGLPNQDALKYLPKNGDGNFVILSVADGHGSKNYFRSDVGSQLAVDVACEVCTIFLKDYSDKDTIKDIKFREVICREIVRKWRDKVNSHVILNPFTPDEEALIQKKQESQKNVGVEKIRYRPSEGLEDYRIIPYGSTILSIIITEDFILYLQLGDGDILTFLSDGTVSRPLPKDDRLIANETTSLCLPVAWDEFRVRFQPRDTVTPALIMVSSDGYSNSFSNANDFEKVGSDILKMIADQSDDINKGIAFINDNIEKWLNETSEKGSGDDITVGLICNINAIKEFSRNRITSKPKKEVIESGDESKLNSEDTIEKDITIAGNPENEN